MVSRETEEVITKIKQGANDWRETFADFNNTERVRAIEMFIEWLNNQKFSEDE